MYLDKVSLKNIRGFENLAFSLKRPDGSYAGWTVFTGDNGSGKSTLLKAIAVAMAGAEVRFTLEPNLGRWIRSGAAQGTIELEVVDVLRHNVVTVHLTSATTVKSSWSLDPNATYFFSSSGVCGKMRRLFVLGLDFF